MLLEWSRINLVSLSSIWSQVCPLKIESAHFLWCKQQHKMAFWIISSGLKKCSRFALYTLYTKGPTQASRHSLRCWSNLVVQLLHVLPQSSYVPCLLRQREPQTCWDGFKRFESTRSLSNFDRVAFPGKNIGPNRPVLYVLFPGTEISVDTLQGLSGLCLEVFLPSVHLMCLDDLVHVIEPPSNHSIHRVDGPLHFTHEADTLLELLTIQIIQAATVFCSFEWAGRFEFGYSWVEKLERSVMQSTTRPKLAAIATPAVSVTRARLWHATLCCCGRIRWNPQASARIKSHCPLIAATSLRAIRW